MKVLMYAIFPSDGQSPKGGVETATYNLLCGFKQLDIDILVISFNKDISEIKSIQFSPRIQVKLFPYRYPKSTILEIFLNSAKILKKQCQHFNPDIVHIQGNGSRFYVNKVFKGIPIVSTPHAILSNEYKNLRKKSEKFNYKIMMYVEKKRIKLLSGILYIADFYKEFFEKKYPACTTKKNITLSNAVRPIFFEKDHKIADTNELVYVGVINRRKNLTTLLEALNELVSENINFHLNIVGGFDDADYQAEIENYISQKKLSDNITFHGWKTQSEVLEIIQARDIFILPSKAEGLPISIAEALSLGKVVVSSDVGGIPEMITHGENGFLFSPEKPKDIVKLLSNLYNNSSLIRSIGNKAKEIAIKKYLPLEVANSTLNFYQENIAN